MFNIVYSFDENYNQQAFVSICSLMEKISRDCNIFILHKDGISFKNYEKELLKNFRNLKLSIFTFVNEGYFFPKLDSAHVSEATYYRLYFDKYIPNDIEYFLYIDADVICMNDPSETIDYVFSELSKSKYVIAAREELASSTGEVSRRKSLGVTSAYFNAGIFFINFNSLLNDGTFEILRTKTKELEKEIVFWDQDILNSFYNGNFLKLQSNLNFNPNDITDLSKVTNKSYIKFLHYQGSNKPWNIDGIFSKYSIYYHKIYKKYGLGTYHITTTWKTYTLKKFINSIFTLKFLKLRYPLKYITSVIILLLSKKAN